MESRNELKDLMTLISSHFKYFNMKVSGCQLTIKVNRKEGEYGGVIGSGAMGCGVSENKAGGSNASGSSASESASQVGASGSSTIHSGVIATGAIRTGAYGGDTVTLSSGSVKVETSMIKTEPSFGEG